MAAITKEKLAELLARARAGAAAAKQNAAVAELERLEQEQKQDVEIDLQSVGITAENVDHPEAAEIVQDVVSAYAEEPTAISLHEDHEHGRVLGVARDDLTYNEKQQEVINKTAAGENVVLIGKAGTGKTTCMRGNMKNLIATGRIKNVGMSTKWLNSTLPGVAVLSYTRKAVNNIRHAMPDELKPHTLTVHKILEFAPVYYEVFDEQNGKMKKTMRFEPKRNAYNPLPTGLKFVAFEESSMVSVDLHQQLMEAIPHNCQFLYLGDIQQLPPVFGSAILGFKMLELPVVELTEVYRQALESPILRFALAMLDGDTSKFSGKTEKFRAYHPVFGKEVDRIRVPALDAFAQGDELVLQVWQKRLKEDDALFTSVKQFSAWEESGYYNPEEDVILIPFNKSFGTIELNKGIAQYLGTKRDAVVHEVIAGFNKYYLAVGDRVLYDKEDAFIVDIVRSDEYMGKAPQLASRVLDRWGHYREGLENDEAYKAEVEEEAGFNLAAIEKFMETAAKDIEDRTAASSHVITLRIPNSGDEEVVLSKSADINALLGGYAITVHKAQGSEWDKVFFIMHQSHAVMNQRELLYTACTRAAKKLHIICENDTFERGIRSQAIKGNTLAEKAEFFKGKSKDLEKLSEVKRVAGVQAQAGEYKGAQAPAPISLPEPVAPPVPLIRMCEFISDAFRNAVAEQSREIWKRARLIWGESIGAVPPVDFNLQRSSIIGCASLKSGVTKLNPVWCLVAEKDSNARDALFENTLVHEACHHIAYRYAGDTGHSSGWEMAMKLMGLAPDVYYTGSGLPDWASSYREIAASVEADLKDKNADTSSDYIFNSDDEV